MIDCMVSMAEVQNLKSGIQASQQRGREAGGFLEN